MLQLGSGDTDGKVATAPLDGRTTATFELVAATTKVTVRSDGPRRRPLQDHLRR